ncbi:MAG: Ig-like domain-containing protein, partial [Nitrospira sp.]|nr:Ig-like domain-containing protein [Nitrospira sp.]
TDLTSIEIAAGAFSESFLPSAASRPEEPGLNCSISFSASGPGFLNPQATLYFRDGSNQIHSESFQPESNAPALRYDAVSLSLIDGQQYLITRVEADDDTDIQYLGFSVTGIRASALRAAGGVVDIARESAFAKTDGVRRVYPDQEQQLSYVLSLPVTAILDAQAVAHDGVVLLDVVAVDASNNQTTLSQIAFTGSDVVEKATALQVLPAKIIFTSLLETATIVPSVDFQFRGLTALPGAGNGVSYVSSSPDFVAVTPGGIAYPLQETGSQQVSITVSYPGLPAVAIPVEVNTTKTLLSLDIDGLSGDGQLVLPRLNEKTPLPAVYAVFDDGSRVAVGTQFALSYELSPGTQGILAVDAKGALTASAMIPASAPAILKIYLSNFPALALNVPVAAIDALPQVAIKLPARITVGEELLIRSEASDDVAVKDVQFLMNGTRIGGRATLPYEVAMTVSEDLLNQTLVFQALATDSAGQSNLSPEYSVQVVAAPDKTVPDSVLELPTELQRFVERSPLRIQVARKLENLQLQTTKIDYVDFFIDGRRVGESYFPMLEIRQEPDALGKLKDVYYLLWRFDTQLPDISVTETSMSVYAVTHADNGGSAQLESKLVRVVQNQPPEAQISKPVAGDAVTVGQVLDVAVVVRDDTLPVGTRIELLLNDNPMDSFYYADPDQRYAAASSAGTYRHGFKIFIAEEYLGQTLRLQARVSDMHGEISKSEIVKINVKPDQAPSVAISAPVAGAQFVAGLPIEIEAQATDDVAITRVDFYVDGKLIGSDNAARYSASYQTVTGLTLAQTVTIYAIAVDSKQQTSKSAEVQVVLGKDEEPPVVNIVSPAVSGTQGGVDIAAAVENSDVVLKVTGFDNVGAQRLELTGVAKSGSQYVLTGQSSD